MQKECGFDILQIVEYEFVFRDAESPVEDVGFRLGHQILLLVSRIGKVNCDQLVAGSFEIRFEGEKGT